MFGFKRGFVTNNWMFTVGVESRWAIRITRGRLDKLGRWHAWQPCVFRIINGRRV